MEEELEKAKKNNIEIELSRNSARGITLITLVITIILLIILAGITINLSFSENGLFNRAKEAKNQYINVAQYEQSELTKLANKVDEIGNNENKQNINKGKLVEIINSTHYGKTINYSANGVNDWKVLYNDGTNVYIISSDYVENSKIPDNIGIGKGGKYGVYFQNVDNKQAAQILQNKSNWEIFATGKGAKEAYRRSNFRYVYTKLE